MRRRRCLFDNKQHFRCGRAVLPVLIQRSIPDSSPPPTTTTIATAIIHSDCLLSRGSSALTHCTLASFTCAVTLWDAPAVSRAAHRLADLCCGVPPRTVYCIVCINTTYLTTTSSALPDENTTTVVCVSHEKFRRRWSSPNPQYIRISYESCVILLNARVSRVSFPHKTVGPTILRHENIGYISFWIVEIAHVHVKIQPNHSVCMIELLFSIIVVTCVIFWSLWLFSDLERFLH